MSKRYKENDFIIYEGATGNEVKAQIIEVIEDGHNSSARVINEFRSNLVIPMSKILDIDREKSNEQRVIDFDKKTEIKNYKCSMPQILGIIGICLGLIYGIILGCIGLSSNKRNYNDTFGEKLCWISIILAISEFLILSIILLIKYCSLTVII